MSEFTMSAAALVLVLPHRSTDEKRPLLNGLFLRADGTAIATNGHTLGMSRFAHTLDESVLLDVPKEFAALVKAAARARSKHKVQFGDIDLTCEWTSKAHEAVIVRAPLVSSIALTVPVIDGGNAYPKIENVLPTTEPVAIPHIGFDSSYLEKRFGGSIALTFYGADKPVLVRLNGDRGEEGKPDNFLGVIMPVRVISGDADEYVGPSPHWVVEQTPAQLKAERAVREEAQRAREVDIRELLVKLPITESEFFDVLYGGEDTELSRSRHELRATEADSARIELIEKELKARGFNVAPVSVLPTPADPLAGVPDNVRSLVTCPASDVNYKSALTDASDDELQHAHQIMEGTPKGNGARIKAVEREIKRRGVVGVDKRPTKRGKTGRTPKAGATKGGVSVADVATQSGFDVAVLRTIAISAGWDPDNMTVGHRTVLIRRAQRLKDAASA